MKTVIAEEQARKEIAEWAEFFEAELSEESILSLLPSVMRGRVILDEESEQFIIELRSPIELKNGEKVTSVTMREPMAGELQDAGKFKNDMDMAMNMYSKLTGHPLGIIQRLKQRDLIAISGVFDFFG